MKIDIVSCGNAWNKGSLPPGEHRVAPISFSVDLSDGIEATPRIGDMEPADISGYNGAVDHKLMSEIREFEVHDDRLIRLKLLDDLTNLCSGWPETTIPAPLYSEACFSDRSVR